MPAKATLHSFVDLEGVKRKELRGPFIHSVSAAADALSRHRVISTAGDNGAINIWRDDAGNYRAAFMQYMSVKDGQTFTTKKAAMGWLKEFLPKCKD